VRAVRYERVSNIAQAAIRAPRPRDGAPAVGPRRRGYQPGCLRLGDRIVHRGRQHARVVLGSSHRRQVCARLHLPRRYSRPVCNRRPILVVRGVFGR
jgi:hypothetical protein